MNDRKTRRKAAEKRRFKLKAKRFFRELLIVILKLAILAAIVFAGTKLIVVTNGHFHLITAASLDLRDTGIKTNEELSRYIRLSAVDLRGNGLTIDEYRALKAERPDMYIRWEVPIDGQLLDSSTDTFVFADIPSDAENLALFDGIRSIKVVSPTDRDAIVAFAAQFPEGTVDWNVRWGNDWIPVSTQELTVEGGSELFEELLGTTAYLPQLRAIIVTGNALSPSRQSELVDSYPGINFVWDIRLGSDVFKTDARSLSFTPGTGPSTAELEAALRFLPMLESIDFEGTSVSAADRCAFRAAHPEIECIWRVSLLGSVYQNNITLLHFDSLEFENIAQIEKALELLPDVEAVEVNSITFAAGKGAELSELESAAGFVSELKGVDFEGSSVSAADRCAFRAAHPEIECSWSVSFMGTIYPNTQKQLYFESLTFGNAAELVKALELLPDIEKAEVNRISFTKGSGATFEELEQAAAALSGIVSVDFEGSAVEPKDRCDFRAAHPEIDCSWSVSFMGEVYDNTMTELHLDGIPFENTDKIHDALALWPDMQRVEIDNTGLSDDEIGALVDEFPNVKFIWTIYFCNYYLRTDATFFIPSAWKGGWTLYNRDVKSLRYCTDMVGLDLGHTCVETLDFVKYMPHLKYLIIVDSSVYDISPLSYCKELEYLEAYVLGIRDFSPLLECPNLKHLNIGYTRSPANAAFEVLSQMTQLERLWYCCCPFSYDQIQAMHEALPNCEMYMPDLGQSTGSTWRYHQSYYDMRDLFGMYYMPGGTAGTDAYGNQVIIDDWNTRIVLYDWDLTQRWFEMPQYKNLNWHIVGINC